MFCISFIIWNSLNRISFRSEARRNLFVAMLFSSLFYKSQQFINQKIFFCLSFEAEISCIMNSRLAAFKQDLLLKLNALFFNPINNCVS